MDWVVLSVHPPSTHTHYIYIYIYKERIDATLLFKTTRQCQTGIKTTGNHRWSNSFLASSLFSFVTMTIPNSPASRTETRQTCSPDQGFVWFIHEIPPSSRCPCSFPALTGNDTMTGNKAFSCLKSSNGHTNTRAQHQARGLLLRKATFKSTLALPKECTTTHTGKVEVLWREMCQSGEKTQEIADKIPQSISPYWAWGCQSPILALTT